MGHHLLVDVDHNHAPGAGGGQSEGKSREGEQHLDVEQPGAATGQTDEVNRQPFGQA